MRYYAAPMEGLTGYVFRNAHHTCFPGTDGYFTPFVSPGSNHELTTKEMNDLLPVHNVGTPVVPQILASRAEDFLWCADMLSDMGYEEVNLNLGCPSPTVVTKGKGSGMLADKDRLDTFLDAVFSHTHVRISIKTRIGLTDADQFETLIGIFNKFPLSMLIVHPRTQADLYKKSVHPEAFEYACKNSVHPPIYNGDIFSAEAFSACAAANTSLPGVMFGRGLIANPHLVNRIKGCPAPAAATLRAFHDMIYEGYLEIMPGDRALLFRMKELWHYMSTLFPERGNFDKKLKKTATAREYSALVNNLFDNFAPDFSAVYEP